MAVQTSKRAEETRIEEENLLRAYALMCTSASMAALYDERRDVSSKYVHSTSRGHEAIQIAVGMHLKPVDYASLYYRDESILLAIGMEPYELMLQLMAKADDPFTGGRSYYSHPALRRPGFPTIPHQSAATGMQAIPATGMAQAIRYMQTQGLLKGKDKPIVLCSLGDGSVTEGEVAEALQMAVLKRLPIIYLVQDNGWGISARGEEMRAMNAYEYAAGFKGLHRITIDGSDFVASYDAVRKALDTVRRLGEPLLLHAVCPLLGHHTSGVRKEWYRQDDLASHAMRDPLPKLEHVLIEMGVEETQLAQIRKEAKKKVAHDFTKALDAKDPDEDTFDRDEFAPTQVTKETGNRTPRGAEKVVMVDAALHAIDEILKKHPEALFYGQDVGRRLGGVFREAATLAEKYGDARVFNTPIQEAYLIGSTAGMSAVGAKPIVEIQFADYIWPGINQLVIELSKSYYLSKGKFPIHSLIRVPVGAYGGGGPYHSGSIESTLLTIRGIRVVYPSNAADMKGLMKAAFYDPNPVIMLEHKGLYWSKLPGTAEAKTPEPDEDYIIPLGQGRFVQDADPARISAGESCVVITYGMGVYWAKEASKQVADQVAIIDLRCLQPLDWKMVSEAVRQHNKVLIVSEEPVLNSFAQALAGRISSELFHSLDFPVQIVGAANLPAVPLNIGLERRMLPNEEKVQKVLMHLLQA